MVEARIVVKSLVPKSILLAQWIRKNITFLESSMFLASTPTFRRASHGGTTMDLQTPCGPVAETALRPFHPVARHAGQRW